ncbi:MAG: hypothetical protein ABJD13_15595 [Paracoccaceae bacterium]
MTGPKTLRWDKGQVTMQPRGAMLQGLTIELQNGRTVSPLHTAPWVGTPEAKTLDGLIQGLSGEWPCIPFGVPQEGQPPEWCAPEGWEDPFAHGYAAHHDWDVSLDEAGLEANIRLPIDHPIQSIRRRVQPIQNGIELDQWVNPRRDCTLPIGLHPVFALPDDPGRMSLDIPGATSLMSHPETPQPDPTPVKPNAISSNLSCVQGEGDETLDFSLLPRPENSETRLLVLGGTGQVSLTDRMTGDIFSLTYDAKIFPFVMLWISNKGRSTAPWSGRHLALGIEPVCAAFDLGTSVSTTANPLRSKGFDTAYEFKSGQRFHTRYQIKAQAQSIGVRSEQQVK